MLLAQCCENNVVPHVLPFVQENIKHEVWQRRDAAVMAFGKECKITILKSVRQIMCPSKQCCENLRTYRYHL